MSTSTRAPAISSSATAGLAGGHRPPKKKIADVKLTAHPESLQLDPTCGRVFVNVPDAGHIAIIDLAAARQVASGAVPGPRANFPVAISGSGTAGALVFRHPAKLVLLDIKTLPRHNSSIPAVTPTMSSSTASAGGSVSAAVRGQPKLDDGTSLRARASRGRMPRSWCSGLTLWIGYAGNRHAQRSAFSRQVVGGDDRDHFDRCGAF